jgi:serine/threonine-protein kinase
LVLGGLTGALLTRALSAAGDIAAAPSAHFLLSLPPTAQLGALDFPSVALAPDGSRLAYVATRGGQTQIYVRSMNSLDAVPLAGTTNAVAPFFSPDGQWIAFFADGQLKKIALAGGAAVTVCEAKVGLGGSWGRDDTIVFASTTGSGLSRVSASGGTPERVTTLDVAQGEFSHRWPEWLPDGTTVLYTAGTSGSFNDAAIVAHSLTSNRRSIIVRGGTSPHYLPTGFLIYAQKGRIMRVPFDADSLTVTGTPVTLLDNVLQSSDGAVQLSVSASGTVVFVESGSETDQPRLVSVARDGVSTPLAASPAPYASPRVSPDGRKLLVTLTSPTPDLWVYDMAAGTSSQLTFDAGAMSAAWSRDAKQVVFSSTRLGVPNLFTTAIVPGAPVERVITSGNQQIPGSWTDDGTVVYAEQFAETGRDILLISPKDRMAQPLVATRADETSPRVSPDGRWLAYVSNETGRPEVYVKPSTNQGRSRQISTEGGTEPVWAPIGLVLFYREGDKMMSVATSSSQNPAARVLFVGDFARGTIDSPNYDVAPDGRFVMIQRPRQSSPQALHVIINAFATLGGSSPR